MLRLEQTAPDKLPLPIRLRKETVERWREENEAHKIELTRAIQQELGYLMVPIFRRTPREDQLLLVATSPPAAFRSRRRRCSTRTSPPT